MTNSDHSIKLVTFRAADGYVLSGTLFPVPNSKVTVIVHGATAVPQGFYRRFAEYLQKQGWSVLTYDFRGVGASRPDSLVGFKTQASDWGLYDIPAALEFVSTTLQPEKIYFVGHSSGGQQAGLLSQPDRVDAMVTLSAQSGYWRYQGGAEKIKVLLLVTVILPLIARAMGYFPWSKFARGEDLPKGVALQWSRWCRSPDYLLGDKNLPIERYQNFTAPVLAYSIDDDDWGTALSVKKMMSAYPDVEFKHLIPAEEGLKKLGHMGFFRKESQVLWQKTVDWLRQH